jgi:hypothetical protein
VTVPIEAAVVERIFRDYLAGVSQQGIQRALNRDGVKTTRGATWHQGTIGKMLADPFYAGLVPDDEGALIAGRQPAIIDRQVPQTRERRGEHGPRRGCRQLVHRIDGGAKIGKAGVGAFGGEARHPSHGSAVERRIVKFLHQHEQPERVGQREAAR